MKSATLFTLLLIAMDGLASAQTTTRRMPDFQAQCTEIMNRFNQGGRRIETLSFKNFHGHPQQQNVELEMVSQECTLNNKKGSFYVKKMNGAPVAGAIFASVQGEETVEVTVSLSNCVDATLEAIKVGLTQQGLVWNDAVFSQVYGNLKTEYCPKFEALLSDAIEKSVQ